MKKVLSLLLALVLMAALVACGGPTPAPSNQSASAAPSPSVSVTPTTTPTAKYPVKAGFLKGPTGIGAAWLMDQSSQGKTQLDYTFTLEADPTIMMSNIVSGAVDIAAVPTNMAAALYKKTNGGVEIIAVNTLSVLYILENGGTVKSIADLKGKTIYATGQAANPEYVLNYILRQNGLEPGKDVTVEFADASEIATKMASGAINLCMLPVPSTTSVLVKNPDVHVALDLGKAWEAATGGNKLTQGCIVVRSGISHLDDVVSSFLGDYEKSVNFMADKTNLDAASQLAAQYEMVGSAAIAKKAIPDCNLVFIAGAKDIKASVSGYFDVLFKADPKSVGGALPDDAFYYGN